MAKRAEKRTGLFLQIVGNGKMGMYVENPTDYSETYTNSEGKTRNYEFFESIQGKLNKVYSFDKDFGNGKEVEMFVVTLINGEGNKESLTMPFNSPYAQSFIKRLEGINLNENLEIKTFRIKDKEKSKEKGKDIFNELCLPYQLNEKGEMESIKSDYVKDGSKQLPDAVITEKKEKGKMVKKYDFTEQKEALRDIIKVVASEIKDLEPEAIVEPINEIDYDKHLATEETEKDNDDLPF